MRRHIVTALLLLPTAVVFLAVFVTPMAFYFALSFWKMSFYHVIKDVSLKNYVITLSSYENVLAYTLWLALITATVVTVAAFSLCCFLRFSAGRWANPFLLVVILTMFSGYLMKIYAWKIILGNNGLINSALISLGLIHEPLTYLIYTPGTVVVTLANFLLPMAVLPIYASLNAIPMSEIESGSDLGAKFPRLLIDIIVPRCRTGIMGAFALSFLLTVGDYVTPSLVGGRSTLFGNLIAAQFSEAFDPPLGAAMSFTVLASSLLLLGMIYLALQQWRPR